jgi:hypothetical protein
MNIYTNPNEVAIMWQQTDRKARTTGTQETKFNVKKGIELQEGDLVFLSQENDIKKYWQVAEILESRQSSLSGYNYVTTLCLFVTEKNPAK